MSAQSVATDEARWNRIGQLIGEGKIKRLVISDDSPTGDLKYWLDSIMDSAADDCCSVDPVIQGEDLHLRIMSSD